ncbi:MAG TPA: ROK family protein [Herpetosiphonaceae bacterium]
MQVLGIDIGGTGIKGALVETDTGQLTTERFRIPTPQPATPEAVLETVEQIVRHFDWSGPIGCGFPAVVQNGIVRTASNIEQDWLELDINRRLADRLGREVRVINDADAAGLAEMRYGAGRGHQHGVVLMITLGTGIGTAIFTNGQLVPNLEMGQIMVRGKPGERRAAASVRERKKLSWKAWAKGLDEYLDQIQLLTWPDLIILGGGVSKDADKFVPYLSVRTELVTAHFHNSAGIVGAALVAQ